MGIGVKIALYSPTEPWSLKVKLAQWHLAGFNAMCFGMVLFMRPLHGGFKKFYSAAAFRASPSRGYILLSYIAALVATVSISFVPMQP